MPETEQEQDGHNPDDFFFDETLYLVDDGSISDVLQYYLDIIKQPKTKK